MNTHQKKIQDGQLLQRFSELGTKYQLAFSCQLDLPGILMGIDGIRRKMMVLNNSENLLEWKLIDLGTIRSCTLLKTYDPIMAGELDSYSPDRYIHDISLRIITENNEEILLPFYIRYLHNLKDLPRITKPAQDWHHMILKLLPQPIRA